MNVSLTTYHRLAKAYGALLVLMGLGLIATFVVFWATGTNALAEAAPGSDGLGLLILASIGAFALPLGSSLFSADHATSARLQVAACALGMMAALRLLAFFVADLRAVIGYTPLIEFFVLGSLAAIAFFVRPETESPIDIRFEVEIDAPAAEAWEVLGERFADIGEWAVAIHASSLEGELEAGALRTCAIGGFGPVGAGEVTEELLELDRGAMKFSYAARSGLPPMISDARNRWSVEGISAQRCRVRSHATMDLRWWALPMTTWIRWGVRAGVPNFLDELRHRVEQGRPHPRKLASTPR